MRKIAPKNPDWKKILAKLVRKARLESELTKHALAMKSGVDPSTVSHIESGKGSSVPSAATVISLARTLYKEPLDWFEAIGVDDGAEFVHQAMVQDEELESSALLDKLPPVARFAVLYMF